MLKIINDVKFILYKKWNASKYWKCFYFITMIPMNRIKEGNNLIVTVNGRNTPYAKLTVEIPSELSNLANKKLTKPVFTWRINEPIYAINHTVIKIEWEDLYKPPLPLICWKYYERYKRKTHY